MKRVKTFPREMLWAYLEPIGGAQWVRFDTTRCYFQFALPAIRLAVEIDSGLIARVKWPKYNRANTLGWHILRFTEHEIRAGIAVKMIDEYLIKYLGQGEK